MQEKQLRQTMQDNNTALFSTYAPAHYKTFQGALSAFFEQECPQMGGMRTRQTLVNLIHEMVLKFYPETSHLRQGQTVWTTVHKDEKGSYGKSIKNTKLTPVVLTLVQETDASERANGKKLRDMKSEAAVRLCNQAYAQDGCLTLSEISLLLKISPNTASKYILSYEKANNLVVPRRGTIHDIGPTLTHKKIIINKLFIEQKTVQETVRETCHSPKAIERYITAFKQVLLCHKKGLSKKDIAFSLKKREKLVQEYLDVIDEYKDKGYILDKLENYEVKIETVTEREINSMTK